MNKFIYKILSIVFCFISFGAISETLRIITSSDIDIAQDRTSLTIMAIFLTSLMLFLAVFFWKKSKV